MKILKLIPTLLFGLPIWLISGLIPKQKNLWIFGAWYGNQYSDNSRAIFEKASNDCPEIQAIWFTRDPSIVTMLNELGYQTELSYSLRGFWLAMRAHSVFVSSGMVDVNQVAANAPRLVQLYHGIPIKKIGDDARAGFILVAYRIIRLFFPFVDPSYDYLVTSSPRMSKIFSTAYPHAKSFVELGLPRNDVLAQKNDRYNETQKTIVYLPTFRANSSKAMKIFENFSPELLQKILENSQSYFIIKLHPIQTKPNIDLSKYNRISFAEKSLNTYDLLKNASILITDYSSVYIDFLLTDRPIIHLANDLEEYCSKDRGLYFSFQEVAAGEVCKSWHELNTSLETHLSGSDEYYAKRKLLRDLFYLNTDAGATQRVLEYFKTE